uniref:G-protein coupled receptors family 3 profile domain-containing protein n=1 Tax=Globodera rostochiensis TaxID=31243 RepID=A0A914GQ16_GLORO
MLYSHVTLLMLRVVDVITKTSVQQSAKMLVGELPGDIQIGALFPMHRQIAGSEGCGAIWEQYGIQRAEIAMLTVQELNKVLPFRLGISIRDSCWTERIAMEQTIAFLREGVTQCSCCQTAGCQKKDNPVVAIVGPAKSSTTIAVQNLLQVFRIPQIGYSATTTDLSDKEQFGYYLRVVPSDAWQAMTINQLLMHFNWTYIAVVYSAGNYGEKGFEAMERLTRSGGSDVCIAHAQKVKSLGEPTEYRNALRALNQLSRRPQVIVCFCEGMALKRMFLAQKALRLEASESAAAANGNNTTKNRIKGRGKRRYYQREFQWIGSDGWADRLDVVEGVEEEAAGSFSIRIHSPNVRTFEPYYFALNPHNHTRNPWFREFWQQKFKCLLTVPKDDTVSRQCTGLESLASGYEQDPKLSQVINAIRVVGFALREMYNDKCPSSRQNVSTSALLNAQFESPCPEMETINGTLLFRYMMNVSFVDEFQQEISFDASGDPPAWYDILNYVGGDHFRLAGDFRQTSDGSHRLRMLQKKLMFYDKTDVMPESVCSKPCGIGQHRRQSTACCWTCEDCLETQFVNASTSECNDCPLGQWPEQSHRQSCKTINNEYQSMAGPAQMAAIAFASVGILCTFLCILVFVNFNSTPVVKSTTRELSFIILGGIVVCYLCTYVLLAPASDVVCFFTRTVPPIAFSAIYSALFTKTNRIARILAGSKKRILTKKPRFLSTFSQVVITWALVGVQCAIVAVSVMEEMPQSGHDPHFMPRRMVVICTYSTRAFLAPFVWNFILILFCTLYAFKTRNLPENFNEAKFIGFTMYCTLVTWGAFVVLYVNAVNKALTASFTFSLSASIALCLLFFPKIFIILLRPEKNVRSSYTTTKLIRCHFGNSQALNDSKQFSSSKTRNSSQSLSLGCPTRTASLHVANYNSVAGSPTCQHPRKDAFVQTELSTIICSSHQPQQRRQAGGGASGGFARFTRTFSVMGGTAAGAGGGPFRSGAGAAGSPGPISAITTLGTPPRDGSERLATPLSLADFHKAEKKSRRRTLDDDVMELINSCRRYQDERLLINPSTIHNMLLEEPEEMIAGGEETPPLTDRRHSGEKVTQLLAGTVRTLAQTVSRTAAGTPTSPGADGTGHAERQQQLETANIGSPLVWNSTNATSSLELQCPGDVSRATPTRSSLKGPSAVGNGSDSARSGGQQHHVEFAAGANTAGREQLNGETATAQSTTDDSFEELLRSRGIHPVQISRATQL